MASSMIYFFELFSVSAEGDRRRQLGVMQHHFKALTLAEQYAKAIVKHTVVKDRKVDLCVIKDKFGKVLSEVR
jgi:hypothetical protein